MRAVVYIFSISMFLYIFFVFELQVRVGHTRSTPCPRKNYNTVYVAITLANNGGF